jgi:hypothetical protein
MIKSQIIGIGNKNTAELKTINGDTGLKVFTKEMLEATAVAKPYLNPTFGSAMNQNVTFGGVGNRATVIHAGVNSGSGESGTTDGATTTNKLIQSGQNFQTTLGPGALVHNTTDDTYAIVTAVDSDTQLSLDTDIMETGETYTINDIWTGTAVVGSWNFADSGKISITSADNNDEADFNVDSSHIWNAQYFTAFTGKIDLDIYSEANNSIILNFGLDDVIVGNTIDLNDYIDTSELTEQSFVIPISDLGLSDQNINSMTITILRTGGLKPTMSFDDFQLEASGSPAEFCVEANEGTKFYVTKLIFAWADTGTDGTAYAYDQIGAISALTNGFVLQTKSNGKTIFTSTVKQLSDLLSAGAIVVDLVDDGTDTYTKVEINFLETRPVILDSRDADQFTITINDDLSGLILFNCFARGYEEVL